jgi:hypothetical protein
MAAMHVTGRRIGHEESDLLIEDCGHSTVAARNLSESGTCIGVSDG